jgi:hypothetical protein
MLNKILQAPGPNNARVESDPTGVIDVAAFNQILELEEDDTLAYSRDMIAMYFAQAPETFAGMDAALYVSRPPSGSYP